MNSWNRCCSTITTTKTTLSSKFEDRGITEDFWIARVPTANWKSFWIVEDFGSSNYLGSSKSILSAKFTFGPSKTSGSSNYLESSMTIFPFKNNFEIYQNIRKTPSNSQTSPRSQADSSSAHQTNQSYHTHQSIPKISREHSRNVQTDSKITWRW